MKKLLSFILAMVLMLALSAVAFADTGTVTDNATAEVPVSVRQEFIDETPLGTYLADVKYVQIDDEYFAYEALYLPLVQSRSSTTSGYKYVDVNYSGLGVSVMRYYLQGSFTYDGTTSSCTSITRSLQYKYDNPGGYTFTITRDTPSKSGNQGYVDLVYNAYWNGSYVRTVSNFKPTIACDEYGNVY